MALGTNCQTPGAYYSTEITPSEVIVRVILPNPLEIDGNEAELLEFNMHNAMELVLKPYFRG